MAAMPSHITERHLSATPQMPQIPEALSALRNKVDMLESTISSLIERLIPVTHSGAGAQVGGIAVSKVERAALAEAIHDQTCRLVKLNEEVLSTLDNLQL